MRTQYEYMIINMSGLPISDKVRAKIEELVAEYTAVPRQNLMHLGQVDAPMFLDWELAPTIMPQVSRGISKALDRVHELAGQTQHGRPRVLVVVPTGVPQVDLMMGHLWGILLPPSLGERVLVPVGPTPEDVRAVVCIY